MLEGAKTGFDVLKSDSIGRSIWRLTCRYHAGRKRKAQEASFHDSEHISNLDPGQHTSEAPPRFVAGAYRPGFVMAHKE